MCKFENQLLLCTCENNLKDNLISWKLVRKTKIKPKNNYQIIGQIAIPDEFKHLSEEELEERNTKMTEYANLFLKRKQELNNIVINIEKELNKRNCFDTNIELLEKDILTILIDKEFTIWAHFIFAKSKWKIFDSFLDDEIYTDV